MCEMLVHLRKIASVNTMATEAKLTKEQETFLEECLLEFSDRFTDSDLEYKQIYSLGVPKPPIMYPWYTRHNYRNHNRSGDNRRYHHHRNNDRNRDYSNHHHQQHYYRPY